MKDANIIKNQLNIYHKLLKEHGNTTLAIGWNNIESQNLRFERLLKNFDLTQKTSIHDIGSGFADLHQYLLKRNIEHTYSGIEIVPELREAALKKFPYLTILNKNAIEYTTKKNYDIVLSSGVFNMNGGIENSIWQKVVTKIISKMFSIAKVGIAFNFLTTYKTKTNNSLVYFDPRELYDFCMKNLSRFIVLDNSYPLYECTITIFKKSHLEKKFNKSEYLTYLK